VVLKGVALKDKPAYEFSRKKVWQRSIDARDETVEKRTSDSRSRRSVHIPFSVCKADVDGMCGCGRCCLKINAAHTYIPYFLG
jgi:hypothetical protein